MDSVRQPRQLSFAFDATLGGQLLCERCGTPFERRYSRSSRNRYCTVTCYNAVRVANRTRGLPCAAQGCEGVSWAAGWCKKHYSRIRRHGTPEGYIEEVVPLNLPAAEAGWVAGILDGEGLLAIHKRVMRGQTNYRLIISVSNTDREMIQALLRITGLGRVTYKKAYDNNRRQLKWAITPSIQIKSLLIAVNPYLVTKGERARLMLTFPRTHDKCPAIKEELFQAVSRMNLRGRAHYPDDTLDC